MQIIKPKRLSEGDTVAIVSPSAGVPARFPHIYGHGLDMIKKHLRLEVKEYNTARKSNDYLYTHPRERAEDINNAFADKEVKAIVASIGGDDSVRILDYLDMKAIKNNPKIIMGFSDSTTFLDYIHLKTGLITYNGPTIMAGFAQTERFPKLFLDMIRSLLFEPTEKYEYHSFPFWSDGYPDWAEKSNVGKINERHKNDGWHWLQGNGVVKGRLFGGCADALEFMKGTRFWPGKDFWDGKILFLETSEDKPMPDTVKYWVRNYGSQGILERIAALLIAMPSGYSMEEKEKMENKVRSVLSLEFGAGKIPLVTNMDFGHTDPKFILPIGAMAEVDASKKRFRLLENSVS
ncbi:MAG: LD-carboxypeptidase [Candidatus Marsarchaeota archaeon]|nr:LD-carboxypeptidase [Candidatus Marsarchaeota archaeon]